MDPAAAGIIAAAIALIGVLTATHIGQKQKTDELFLNALNFLDGGSQKRNLGISAVELYWNNQKHRAAAIKLLVGSAVYLLTESDNIAKQHEQFNLERIINLLLRHQPQDEEELNAYQRLAAAVNSASSAPRNAALGTLSVQTAQWQIALRSALSAPASGDSFERVKLLFEYTKFHIGMYATLTAAAVALLGTKWGEALNFRGVWIWTAVAFIGLAGLAGGVIAASLPHFNRIDRFYRTPIGPFRLALFPGEIWTFIEHTAFWLGVTSIIIAFALGAAPTHQPSQSKPQRPTNAVSKSPPPSPVATDTGRK
jgi:hypothetical protein